MDTIARRTIRWSLGWLVVASGAWSQDVPDLSEILDRLQSVEEQLQKSQEALEETKELLKAVSSRLEALEGQREAGHLPGNFDEQGPDFDALKKLKFPEDLTKKALENYIQAILKATEGQNMFTPDDPQVTLLAEVGEENIELLIDAATQSRWNNFHTTQAIIRLATAKSKTLVVNALPKNHDLIEAVVRNGWEDDVRETLVSELLAVGPSGYANYLPEVWIYAVARFGDPETYDALLHYFVHGSNRLSTYDAIRRLPGINIAEHVPEAWQQTRNSHDWERVGMAIVAVAYGEKEALAELFDSLSASDYDYYKGRILRTILEHTTAKGSNEALSDWYEANKHALEFDEQTKKFKAP